MTNTACLPNLVQFTPTYTNPTYLPTRRKRSELNWERQTGANTPPKRPRVRLAVDPSEPLLEMSRPLRLRNSFLWDNNGAFSWKKKEYMVRLFTCIKYFHTIMTYASVLPLHSLYIIWRENKTKFLQGVNYALLNAVTFY